MMDPSTGALQELVSPLPSSAVVPEAAHSDGAASFTDEAVSILTSSSLLARSLLGRSSALKRKESPSAGNMARRKREFIPDEKKDEGYWDKRRKNNEAAKRSREKRRVNDMVLESRVMALLEENARLRAELLALKFRFGLVREPADVPVVPMSTTGCTSAPSAPRYFVPRSDGGHPATAAPPPAPPQGCLYGGGRGSRDAGSLSEDSGFSTPGSSSVGSPVFFDDRMSEHGKLSPHGGEEPGYEPHPCPMGVDGEGFPSGTGVGHYSGDLSREAPGRLDSGEGMKSLPHKLRFKAAGGADGSEAGGVGSESRRSPMQPTGMRDSAGVPVRSHTLLSSPEGPGMWQQNAREEGREGRVLHEQQYGLQLSGYGLAPPQNQVDSHYHMENHILKSQLSSLSEEVAQLKRLFSQQLLSKMN
ncbi:nuclear factor, interleukin 3 regulated, member 3 [Scleropages formosus]|uniref:BZIP domain-containing protein n=1 Tax=Scleropages formosus TaxID=113540 RepID=A0A8C9RCZ4_SCLFO|nr:nuclear factor interleukin-3-regulated protein-like [Scleropages formosus]XP_018617104.1 nuclear factor interleukin-3-regulated protein-like [Scleropages formosus]